MINNFLNSIPEAASSPYALTAYALCCIIFLVAGERLRRINTIMKQIKNVPAKERKEIIEIATETKLPEKISAKDWIRLKQRKWIFVIIISFVISLTLISVISITKNYDINISKKVDNLEDTTISIMKKTQKVVTNEAEKVSNKIEESQDTIIKKMTITTTKEAKKVTNKIEESQDTVIKAINNAALANLETIFPLAVRRIRDIDGTIMHLNGSPEQRIISYDKGYTPMELFWGDKISYFIYSTSSYNDAIIPDYAKLYLIIKNSTGSRRIPFNTTLYSESNIRIPGSSPEPFEAYLYNPQNISGISIKMTVYSTDRERGREEFKTALLNTSLNSAARLIYKSVTVDGLRLRAKPNKRALVLRTLREGTYVKVIKTQDNWSNVRLPEGREGWIASEYLDLI